MAKQPHLQPVVQTQNPSSTVAAGGYAYPDEAAVLELTNGNFKFHLIFGSGDTVTSAGLGSSYASAPNGSIYIPLTATAGDQAIFVKCGARGLTDGTWKATADLVSV